MKIEAGRFYMARNGIIYGPMICLGSPIRYPFRVTNCDFDWGEDGFYQSDQQETQFDLISEVYVSDTPPSDKPAAPPAVKETEDQLREMMRDPRYWRTREPEFIKRVTDGFRALVAGDTPHADAPAPEVKTLRDEFAMAALNGAMVGYHDKPSVTCDNIAKWSYDLADAMMEARKK